MKDRIELLRSRILVLARGDVAVGMGQSAQVRPVSRPHGPDVWEVTIARLLMPADKPLLELGEQGLGLWLRTRETGPDEMDVAVGDELVAGDLSYLRPAASGFIVDGHNTVIYEVVTFDTRVRPAFLGPELF